MLENVSVDGRKSESMFDTLFPPDSGLAVYFMREDNVWKNEEGEEFLDLTDFGFTALQRNTILHHIYMHDDDEYVSVYNNRGELIEIFWEKS